MGPLDLTSFQSLLAEFRPHLSPTNTRILFLSLSSDQNVISLDDFRDFVDLLQVRYRKHEAEPRLTLLTKALNHNVTVACLDALVFLSSALIVIQLNFQ